MGRNIQHKFRAVSVNDDGKHFSSKLEHKYFQQLQLRQKSGEVLFFLLQTPFALPGKTKYICDFTVFLANGEVQFVDCKGIITPTFALKRRQVEEIYPIKIMIVQHGDF